MGSAAWMFPGQGSQVVGMGRELAERYPALDRTANTQPALLTASIASLRAAEEAAGTLAEPVVVLGHSLGEFTALARAISQTRMVVANDNAPGQVVVSGPREDFDRATAAFHSPAMRAVAPDLAAALATAHWDALRVPVIANVDAEKHDQAADFRELLEKQVWSPVQWVASTRRAAGEGATVYVEFGPGAS